MQTEDMPWRKKMQWHSNRRFK